MLNTENSEMKRGSTSFRPPPYKQIIKIVANPILFHVILFNWQDVKTSLNITLEIVCISSFH